MKLVVAITGASGAKLGLKFVQYLPQEIETFVVISKSAIKSLKLEENINIKDELKKKAKYSYFQ